MNEEAKVMCIILAITITALVIIGVMTSKTEQAERDHELRMAEAGMEEVTNPDTGKITWKKAE